MNGIEDETYLLLDDIERKLRAICIDIDRMNFGSAKNIANNLQRALVRMSTHGYEVHKETNNGRRS